MTNYQVRLKFFGKTLDKYDYYWCYPNKDELVERMRRSLNGFGQFLLKLHIFKIEIKEELL